MPEYLAPGVYVEEVSFRADSIGATSTSIAGFIGPTLFGPPFGVPELLTSYSDFENIYGSLDEIHFEDAGQAVNYMAQAVRAFFENGGQQLYVSRVISTVARGTESTDSANVYVPYGTQCCSTGSIPDPSISPAGQPIGLLGRYPGSGGNFSVMFTFHVSQNVLSGTPHDPLNPSGPKDPILRGVNNFDTVWIHQNSVCPPSTGLYWADNFFNPVSKQWEWQFHPETGLPLPLSKLQPAQSGNPGDVVKVITVSAEIDIGGAFPRKKLYENLTFHPPSPTSLSQFFGKKLSSRSNELTVPLIFDAAGLFSDGPTIGKIMMTQPRTLAEMGRVSKLLGLTSPVGDLSILGTLGDPQLADSDRQLQVFLSGGLDGYWPTPRYYEGDDSVPATKTGLKCFEDLTDISIVAAPGSSWVNHTLALDVDTADKLTIAGLLIAHAEKMRYRVALLDSMNGQDLTEVGLYRGQLDSEYAALYFPWVRIVDPVTDDEINLPGSGFMAGLCARNDLTVGVHKAPANMVVQLAIGFELMLNKAQQDVLNPQGINCFRFFEGRGYRIWGARTISSDSQWKYLNIRRYFCYLEHSIDVGTQPLVFEPNSEATWDKAVRSVSDFLYTEWQSGRLMGDKPEQAFFVRCDRSTMTQNDLDNGRLICLIGVAPITPAEFVIFRIGQWVGQTKA